MNPGTTLEECLELDIAGLVLQYLTESGFLEAAHTFEKESNYYFDFEYTNTLFVDGKFDHLISYLSGFVPSPDQHSLLYFEILKQKFLDSLDKGDKEKATFILSHEIKPFFQIDSNPLSGPTSKQAQLCSEFETILGLDDFRKHPNLVWVENARETRKHIFPQIRNYIMQKIPMARNRSQFLKIPHQGRLRTIINHSLNWQLSLLHPSPQDPRVQTLFVDHNFFSNELLDVGNYSQYLQNSEVSVDPNSIPRSQITTKPISEVMPNYGMQSFPPMVPYNYGPEMPPQMHRNQMPPYPMQPNHQGEMQYHNQMDTRNAYGDPYQMHNMNGAMQGPPPHLPQHAPQLAGPPPHIPTQLGMGIPQMNHGMGGQQQGGMINPQQRTLQHGMGQQGLLPQQPNHASPLQHVPPPQHLENSPHMRNPIQTNAEIQCTDQKNNNQFQQYQEQEPFDPHLQPYQMQLEYHSRNQIDF